MRGRDLRRRHRRRGLIAQLDQEARDGIPLAVEILEEPLLHPALRVEDKRAWKRNSDHGCPWLDNRNVLLNLGLNSRIVLVGSEAPFDSRIENAVLLYGGGTDVRQHRERDAVFLAKAREDLDRVVADGREAEPLVAKLLHLSLQLDELRLAVGSPVGRAQKNEHRALRPHDGLKGPGLTRLILEAEIRHALAHLGAELGDVYLLPRLRLACNRLQCSHKQRCSK